MRKLQEEFGAQLSISWRAFLLRPHPENRELKEFVRYTKSWGRVASDSDSGKFRQWATHEKPPSHSLPPQLVAKAAARISASKFEIIHERLLEGYFWENQDISSEDTLRRLWIEVGLPEASFVHALSTELRDEVYVEHAEAVSFGANGVPAVRTRDQEFCIVGAHSMNFYRRWIKRLLRM